MSNSERKIYIIIAIVLVGIIYAVKLFSIQIADSTYSAAAESNVLKREIEHPYRGLIYDRNNKLLCYNDPVFDIYITPRSLKGLDTAYTAQLFGLAYEDMVAKINKARKYSRKKSSIFISMMPSAKFSEIQDNLVGLSGFSIIPRAIRGYADSTMANILGYIGEIDRNQLNADTTNSYTMGDYIGRKGLERKYEKELRGTRGARFKMVNVEGLVKGAFKEGEMDTLSSPGYNIKTTIRHF